MSANMGWPEQSEERETEDSTEDRRLLDLYGVLVQLVTYEGHLVTERSNIFLLACSILFTAFALAGELRETFPFSFMIPGRGIALCFFHIMMGWRTINAANFWRNSIALIERSRTFSGLDSLGLTVFTTHHKYHRGKPVRQQETEEIAGKLPPITTARRTLCFDPLDPTRLYLFWLPMVFLALWFSALYYFAEFQGSLFWIVCAASLVVFIVLSTPYLLPSYLWPLTLVTRAKHLLNRNGKSSNARKGEEN